MRPIRKNSFFEFIFAFIPGAAEMYMGFMKNGLSIMATAALAVLLTGFSSTLMLFVGFTAWAFSFFHARNLSHLPVDELEKIEDRYIYQEFTDGKKIVITSKTKKIFGVILLLVGFSQIWGILFDVIARFIPDAYWRGYYSIFKSIPQLALFIVFVIVGLNIIRGKKDAIDEEAFDEEEDVQ